MDFIDEETRKFCFFDEVISSYKPVSVFGKKINANLLPLRGDELLSHFEFLSKVKACEFNRVKIENVLQDFHEITGSILSIENGTSTDVDLFEIKRFVHHHRVLKQLTGCVQNFFGVLDELWELLDPQKSGSFFFMPENDLIDSLIEKHRKIEKQIDELYKNRIKFVSDKFNLDLSDRRFVLERNRSDELINSNLVMIEREGIKTYTFIVRPTEEILIKENELHQLEVEIKDAEYEEVKRLSKEAKKWTNLLKAEIDKIAKFDIAFARVKAIKDGYTFPHFGNEINLENAFHPVISDIVEKNNFEYTRLTGNFSQGLTIIFGPNMGGKTTVLRTIALSCMLAMYGFLVPAKSAALTEIDWIRFVGSSSQNLDLSGFANQIDKMSGALKNNGKGLILIDEFGSGTNPYEGEALSTALAEYLSHSRHFSVMVTHFKHTIEMVSCNKYTIGRIDFEGEITPQNLNSKINHHLVKGAMVNYGDAIKIAGILGLPAEIVQKAKEFLKQVIPENMAISPNIIDKMTIA